MDSDCVGSFINHCCRSLCCRRVLHHLRRRFLEFLLLRWGLGGGTGYLSVFGFQRHCLVGRKRDGVEPKRGLLKSSGIRPFALVMAFCSLLVKKERRTSLNITSEGVSFSGPTYA